MIRLLIFLLILHGARAFHDELVRETIGGLIPDEALQAERDRIDAESKPQLENPVTYSNYTSENSSLIIGCPTSSLVFMQNSKEPFRLYCNLTYTTKIPLAVSLDVDIHQVASLLDAYWVYLAPQSESSMLNLSIIIKRTRMGSAFVNVWAREALPGGTPESFHPWNRNNATQVQEYNDWVLNNTTEPVMGFHLKVLRKRGLLEFSFRIVIAVLVCGITFVMGCELDGRRIWKHLKKPVGPLIGFACQFGLMPLVSVNTIRYFFIIKLCSCVSLRSLTLGD